MSTEDSRTTETAGQALTGILFNRSWTIGRWETLAEGDRAEMESMAAEFVAAIAAAAPAPAGEPASHVVSHTPAVVRPVLGSVIVLALQDGTPETSARELADTLAALNQGIAVLTVRGVDALRTWEPEQAAPDLTARLAAVTDLLDASHKRDWDSGLAGERRRVADERAGLGMGAL